MTLEIGVWPPTEMHAQTPKHGYDRGTHTHEGKESRVSTLFDLSLLPVDSV